MRTATPLWKALRWLVFPMGIAGVALTGTPALAQTFSTTFTADASIVAGCELSTSLVTTTKDVGQFGSLSFGTHSSLSTDTVTASLAQNSGILLHCSSGVTLSMQISAGQHFTATRGLVRPGNPARIPYRLYRDAGFSQELAVNDPVAISFTSGAPVALPILGRLTLTGDVPAGTYQDTVTVTLSW